MGSSVSSKTSVPPPQVFVLSSMETGRGAPRWKEEKEAGEGPGEEVTFQLPSLIPQKEDMSVGLHNRPQEEASLWCILVMESFNGLSKKSLEQSNLKKPRLLLCIRKQRWAYPHFQVIKLPLFFLQKSLLPSPNLTFLSVPVSPSSENLSLSTLIFRFLYNSCGPNHNHNEISLYKSAIALENSLTVP